MRIHRLLSWCCLWLVAAALPGAYAWAQNAPSGGGAAGAACTATFTSGGPGTFSGTLKTDAKTGLLTADLSAIPADATVFRAELMLSGQAQSRQRPFAPTKVYPDGQPDKPLRFVAPRFVSLDALDAVRAAVKERIPLALKVETTLGGVSHLEVSYTGGKPAAAAIPVVTGVKVAHRAGQSLIVFTEPKVDYSAAVTVPFDGLVKSVEVKAGQKVTRGDLLARMDTEEATTQAAAAKAERERLLKLAESEKAEGRTAEANKAKAQADKTEVQVRTLEGRIARAELKAPIDGLVTGEPDRHAGARLKAGAVLLEVAGELSPGAYPALATGGDVDALRQAVVKKHPTMTFRVWRSAEKIAPATIAKAQLVGECGFFTGWNSGYHQDGTRGAPPLRYHVTDGGEEVPWGTGIHAHNPPGAGKAFYAVTVALGGEEDFSTLGKDNTAAEPVDETVGLGAPVLQWKETPEQWMYRNGTKENPIVRLIYTRWESWPDSSTPSKPIDYLVAMPPQRVEPAPVGLHLHCWGASLNGGYGWWHNGHKGAILIASNQIPYDWWTGYHEANGTCKTFGDGYVQPFTMNRTFAFLDWAVRQWKDAPDAVRPLWRKLDTTRVFSAGSSMGGSGAPMFAIRYGEGDPKLGTPGIGWCIAWVGVHIPAETPQFKGSYEGNYGPRNAAITMPDGKTSPWDFYSDVWWLTQNPTKETGFIMAGNGKDDGGIGWPQALKFARALQETRRPHLFNWSLGGHGVRTVIGANFDLDVRTDQSLPAFTNCTLDGNVGTATPKTKEQVDAERARQEEERAAGKRKEIQIDPYDGDTVGTYNGHLWWKTDDVVDTPEAWEMTVILQASAPKGECKVDLTPRRLQNFKTPKGAKFAYTVADVKGAGEPTKGQAVADDLGLLTLRQIPLVKGENRVKIVPAR